MKKQLLLLILITYSLSATMPEWFTSGANNTFNFVKNNWLSLGIIGVGAWYIKKQNERIAKLETSSNVNDLAVRAFYANFQHIKSNEENQIKNLDRKYQNLCIRYKTITTTLIEQQTLNYNFEFALEKSKKDGSLAIKNLLSRLAHLEKNVQNFQNKKVLKSTIYKKPKNL